MTGIALLFFILTVPQPAPVDDRLEFLSSIHIPQGTVAGEAVCILCSIQVDGELEDEALAVWGNVVVSGSVAKEALAVGGNVRLLSGGRIGDEAMAVGGRVFRDPDTTIGGSIEEAPFLYFPGQRVLPWPGTLFFSAAVFALSFLAAGLLREARTGQLKAAWRRHPAGALILGVAGIALIGFLAGKTPPLGSWSDWGDLLVAVLILVPGWLGGVGLVRLIGDRFFPERLVGALGAGSLALLLLMMVPVVGLLVFLSVLLMGWGASVLSGFGRDADWLLGRFRRKPRSADPVGGVDEVAEVDGLDEVDRVDGGRNKS